MSPKPTPSRLASWINDVRAEVFSFIPTEVGDHLTAAKKELLAAARVVLDEEIRWTDKRWDMAKERKSERKAHRNATATETAA